MTHEEAKQIFLSRGYVEVDGGTIYDADKWRESCHVISEWLEQEPCEDCINRQAAIIQLSHNKTGDDDCDVIIQKDIDTVKSLPSVTPQPKTGHWIEHPEIETSTPEYLMFYECSECGDKQCFCKSDIHKKHFCNN